MSLDLLDRLITDIIDVTESLMGSDQSDLAALQPGRASVEKAHSLFKGIEGAEKKEERPMGWGVHRGVC